MTITRPFLAATLASLLAACSSGPPVPDWKMNAQSAIERFEAAYLAGRTLVEQTEFQRARSQVAGTGKVELIARIELLRCATRVASLAFDACTGFEALREDAGEADRAYARYLAGTAQPADVALLPASAARGGRRQLRHAGGQRRGRHQGAAGQLVAAGVLLRAGRATPELLDMAVDDRLRPGLAPAAAGLAGRAAPARRTSRRRMQEAQRIARRMDLVKSGVRSAIAKRPQP